MVRRLISHLFSSFLLLNFVRRYKNRTSLMKIKAAKVYVLGVKKTRIFFLGILFVLVSFMFLINGLSLIQAALLTYSMWSYQVKFAVSLLLGVIEFSGAIFILFYLFREETWVRFCGIQNVINSVVEDRSDKKI